MSSVALERGAARSAAWSWTTMASVAVSARITVSSRLRARRGRRIVEALAELWSPMRFEPMNLPAAGSGAMMTCTLSESLSASVFWISSG